MQTKFDARDDVVKMIHGYMAEEGVTKKEAINDLIEAGWIAKHQDVLAGSLVADLRLVMEAVMQADRRDREDELDELLVEIDARMEPLRDLADAAREIAEGGGRA